MLGQVKTHAYRIAPTSMAFTMGKTVLFALPTILSMILSVSCRTSPGSFVVQHPPHCSYQLFQAPGLLEHVPEGILYIHRPLPTEAGSKTGPCKVSSSSPKLGEQAEIACPDTDSIQVKHLNFSHAKMRIICVAPYFMNFTYQPSSGEHLAYSGMGVEFKKHRNLEKDVIVLEFPKVVTVPTESLHSFAGIFQIFSASNTGLRTTVNLTVTAKPKEKPQGKQLKMEVTDQTAKCQFGNNDQNMGTDVYFANVGGDSVAESDLLRPCLYHRNESCANKVLGTSCVQSRFCKKIILTMNQDGIVYCTNERVAKEKHYFTGLDLDQYRIEDLPFPTSTRDRLLIEVNADDNEKRKDVTAEVVGDEEDNDDGSRDVPFEARPLTNLNLQKGVNFTFECYYVPYVLVTPIIWKVGYHNQRPSKIILEDTKIAMDLEYRRAVVEYKGLPIEMKIKSSKLVMKVPAHMTSISCSATYWNSLNRVESVRKVNVTDNQGKPVGWRPQVSSKTP